MTRRAGSPTRARNNASSRRKPLPLRLKPVTIGDLIREGKLLEVRCGNCRPERHLYIDAGSLALPKRMPGLRYLLYNGAEK
jgi:hypothetical protein